MIISPDGDVHRVYTLRDDHIPEHHCITFSRLRLVLHSLHVETGRNARLPRQDRFCVCQFGPQVWASAG